MDRAPVATPPRPQDARPQEAAAAVDAAPSGRCVVSTPVFEGPFDLLLHLILTQEVDLWEVHLTTVIDAYLAEIDRMERLDLDVATEFLLVAATLVELKAKRLLPGRDELDLDEELVRFEERDLLLARLLDCKTFQDVAGSIAGMIEHGALRRGRTAGPEEPFRSLAPDPLERLSVHDIHAAAVRALEAKAPAEVRTDHVAPIRASVRDAIDTVLGLLPAVGTVTFVDLARSSTRRLEVVVRFLAVLELYKQGVVDLEQPHTFATLVVVPLGSTADVDLAAEEWDDEDVQHTDATERSEATT